MLQDCGEEGIGAIPSNPIAGGLPSGKPSPSGPPPEGRFTLGSAGKMYQDRYWRDREFDTVDQLRSVAAEAGVGLVTLAVPSARPNIATTPATIAARRPDHLHPRPPAATITLPHYPHTHHT